jgi:signal transduction histidine kinase
VLCLEYERDIVAYNIRSLRKRVLANIKPYGRDYNGLPFCYSAFDAHSNSIWMLVRGPKGTGLLEISLTNGSKLYYTWPCFRNIPNHIHWSESLRYDRKRASIWINSPDGLLEFMLKDKQFHPVEAMKELVQLKDYGRWVGIDLDPQGRIWLATKPKGIIIYDPVSKTLTQPIEDVSTSKQVSENNARIYCDRDGIVWSGFWSPKGFYQLTPFLPAITRYKNDTSKPHSLNNNAVWGIIKGDHGNMWLGTDNGLNVFDPGNSTFKMLRVTDSSGLERKRIIPVLVDTIVKKAWIGADGAQAFDIFEMDLTSKKCRQILFKDSHNRNIPIVNVFKSIPYKHGCIVPGMYGDNESGAIFMVTSDSAIAKQILYFPKGKDGVDLYLVCTDGNLIFLKRPHQSTNLTFSYVKGKWLQTPTPFDSVQWSWIYYNQKDYTYWVISHRQLLHCNKKFEVIGKYTTKDGIPLLDIYDGITDNNGNFWFNTDRALYYLDAGTGNLMTLSEKDGFQKQNFAPIVYAAEDYSGDLYFPGGVFGFGFDRISPDKISRNYRPPAVYIQSLQISQRPSLLTTGVNSLRELTLEYNQNNISIESGIIDFVFENQSNIRYKLEGLNEDWQYVPAYYTIRYNGLPPGNYTLRLQAVNILGDLNPVKSLHIIITPPWFQTWWFYTIIALIVIAILYAFYRYRVNHILQMEKMRTRIASDLHDDIGSTLTSISYYSELVKMQLKEEDVSLKPLLDKIGNSARNMVSAMSDIVWIINPQNDTTSNLVNRMKHYAAEMLGQRNIQYTLNVNDDIEKLKLNMQQRKNLYLIYKEAIHNAVKYSECSKIEIDFITTDHEWNLTINDNGKGFDTQNANEGNGLINLKKRSAEIKADFEINSIQGKGTRIQLTCKIT